MTDLKAALHQKLHEARATMRAKVTGLGEYDLRRPVTPTESSGYLIGLYDRACGHSDADR